ncbi:hypothetical protein C8Q70DRAFT_935322 [Cubamyces menziesii]|nr:hypothetical protein C8Q70DRAFT_935322 [Cubamyces menziesii]
MAPSDTDTPNEGLKVRQTSSSTLVAPQSSDNHIGSARFPLLPPRVPITPCMPRRATNADVAVELSPGHHAGIAQISPYDDDVAVLLSPDDNDPAVLLSPDDDDVAVLLSPDDNDPAVLLSPDDNDPVVHFSPYEHYAAVQLSPHHDAAAQFLPYHNPLSDEFQQTASHIPDSPWLEVPEQEYWLPPPRSPTLRSWTSSPTPTSRQDRDHD